MHTPPLLIALSAAALTLSAGISALAQDADNGRRITERSCASCHAVNMTAGRKASRTISLTAIASKPAMSADIIATFLAMPHLSMPGLRLGRSDARDVAAFIMTLKK